MKEHVFHVEFAVEYLGRDELSEEEVLEEGFSFNDDFSWSGVLPEVWWTEILNRTSKANFLKKEREHQLESLLITIDSQKSFIADHVADWSVFLNEVIQAIYEVAGKEEPLYLDYLLNSSENAIIKELTFSFATRSIDLRTLSNGDEKIRPQAMGWKKGAQLMKWIFTLDFDYDKGISELPKKQGEWISHGDGQWYQLGTTATNPSLEKDLVSKVSEVLKKI